MSLNLNKVMLAGRITADLDLRYTPSQVPCISFTVAVTRSYTGTDGEKQSDFIRCTAWRKTAEFISKYFSKGSAIFIEGEIQTRSWKDEKTGKQAYATEVLVSKVAFVENKKSDGGSYGQGYQSGSYRPTEQPSWEEMQELDEADASDLPF
ncbi:MAG: single-stranded DNA-binding protein [Christensenellales bacterium]